MRERERGAFRLPLLVPVAPDRAVLRRDVRCRSGGRLAGQRRRAGRRRLCGCRGCFAPAAGAFLYNHAPHIMEAIIDRVPPIGTPYSLPVPVILYDDQFGGSPIAQIVSAQHIPIPEPGTVTLLGGGLLVLALGRRRNRAG